MGIANLAAGIFGAVPMCHGTGGLAAHYRFGARTGGAPLMIGAIWVVLALAFGEAGFTFLALLPNSVLGVLLILAGLELCPLIRSLKTNEEYFVALLITGIALAVPNMAWAFGIWFAADLFIRKARIKIGTSKSWRTRKNLSCRHPGERRGPEHPVNTGFRLPPE